MSAPFADTTEDQHAHVCPACGDSWLHANTECEPTYGDTRRTWAKCPIHEGRDEE